MIIVTAGHVDHGKTTLIQALTGTDTDRLPEEKRRGMTIDLGYAFMDIGADKRLAFIDVPGHEKFINNMLTGVSHAKHALLVVACNDGVMPQTLEHLDILNLLPLESLTIALTKCDIATTEQIAKVKVELNQLLDNAISLNYLCRDFFEVSTIERNGVDELKRHFCQLFNACDSDNILNASFRMTLDRVFTVKGVGVVVTGTVISGCVNIEDKLWCSNQSSPLRVRGIHAQGKQTTLGQVGERVALNLVGMDSHYQLSRGDWLTSQKQPQSSQRISALFTGKFTPNHWQSVHFHFGANHCIGRIAYLAPVANSPHQHLVELHFEKPLLLTCLDTLVIRDASAQYTLGGAKVLELTPPSRGKRKADRIDYLCKLAQCQHLAETLLVETLNHAVDGQIFCWNWQCSDEHLAHLAQEMKLMRVNNYIVHPNCLKQLKDILLAVITDYHQCHQDEIGIGANRLQRMSHTRLNRDIVNLAISQLCVENKLQISRGLIHLPQHQLSLSNAEAQHWQHIQALYADNGEPLWISDFCHQLQLEQTEIKGLCYKLVQLGYLTSVVKDRYVQTQSLYHYADKIRHYLHSHQQLETAEFRQLINMGRKVSIQILELFDKTGFTRRAYKANSRVIRDKDMYLAEEHRS